MPKTENGLTRRQEEVLKLIRKGSKVTVKGLVDLSRDRHHCVVGADHVVPNDAVAGYHIGRLEGLGYLELVEGGGRGKTRTWKRVA